MQNKNDSVVLVTSTKAAEWLRKNAFDRNRRIDEYTVQDYADKMRNGQWEPDAVTLMFAREPDKTITLVNGHHTLSAIVASGVSNRYKVRYIDVPDKAAIRVLYTKLDAGLVRSTPQRLHALGLDEKLGLPPKRLGKLHAAASVLLTGLGMWGAKTRPTKKDVNAVAAVMQQYASEAKTLYGWLPTESHVYTGMQRASVMASALHTIKCRRVQAEEFWTKVIDGTPTGGDPRRELHDYLLRKDRAGHGGKLQRMDFAAVALAWNAYLSGESVRLTDHKVKSVMDSIDLNNCPIRATIKREARDQERKKAA